MNKPKDCEINVNVNRDGLEDTLDEVNEAMSELNIPNVIVRNNQNVYITINNFNMTHEQYMNEQYVEAINNHTPDID